METPLAKAPRLPLFIGFSTFEDFVDALDADGLVYVCCTSKNFPMSIGLDRVVWNTTVQQINENGNVHYCHLESAAATIFTRDDLEEWRIQANSLHQLVVTYLENHGYRMMDAQISRPTDFTMLSAHAKFMRLDQAEKRWIANEDPTATKVPL